jgi:RNA polymerase sigma-70 factor (ECF subfamily)
MVEFSESLVQRVRQHDQDALVEFLAERRLPLLAFIGRQLGPTLRGKVEPDDIVQEVSVDCLRSFAEVDLSERDPFGWLCQVAERRIIDAHRHFVGAQKRSAGREQPLDLSPDRTGQGGLVDLLVVSMTSPSAAFSRNEKEYQLLAALDQIPEEGRQALRMRYVQGLPSKVIAEEMGKTDGAVRVLLTRSLKRLQELLGPDAAPR